VLHILIWKYYVAVGKETLPLLFPDTRLFFFAVALRPNAGHGPLILEVFLDHTQRRTLVGRTPLDE